MASENTKHLKHEQDDDEKALSSLLQNKNKKPNGTGSFVSKSLSLKDAKAKKPPPKLKKEEDTDDDDDDLIISRKIKKDGPSSAETKKTPNSEVKKEKSSTSDKKRREKSSEQNGKKKEEKKKVVKGEDSTVKREKKEKKVYDLPGQKRDPPEERDPLRIFYESLYSQIPTSEMAAIWMMESGLLHKDVAKKLFEAKKAQQQKLGSPMKTVVTVKKHGDSSSVSLKKQSDSSSVTVKKKIVSTEKNKTPTPPSKAPTTQSKKRKIVDDTDGSSDEGSDDDFVISRKIKKPKAA